MSSATTGAILIHALGWSPPPRASPSRPPSSPSLRSTLSRGPLELARVSAQRVVLVVHAVYVVVLHGFAPDHLAGLFGVASLDALRLGRGGGGTLVRSESSSSTRRVCRESLRDGEWECRLRSLLRGERDRLPDDVHRDGGDVALSRAACLSSGSTRSIRRCRFRSMI